MDEEEFYSWIESLAPAEREEALYSFGLAGANQVPGTFAQSGMQPGLEPGGFDLSMYNALPPELSKKGEVMPWGLDQQQQAFNTMQDLGAMTVDNALAMYGGPGAYTAGAFEPTQVPIGQPLDSRGQRYLDMMADSGTGYESYIAQRIRDDGMSPGAAVADLWRFIQTPGDEEVDPDQAAAKQALIASLPPGVAQTNPLGQPMPGAGKRGDYTTPEGLAASFDVQGVQKLAADLFERKASDTPVGYVDPQTGLPFAGAKMQPSPLAEKYRAAGIPMPNESYGDEQWLNAPVEEGDVLGRAEREGRAQDRYGQAIEKTNQADTQLTELEKAWRESEDERMARASGQPVKVGNDARNPYGIPEESLWAARQAADLDMQALLESGEGAPERRPFLDAAMQRGGIGPQAGLLSSAAGADRQASKDAARTAADIDYDVAYEEWEKENRDRLLDEAMQRGARATQTGTAAPYVVRGKGNELLGTYNFGGTPEEAQGVGALASVLAQLGGQKAGDVRIGQMTEGTLPAARRGTQTSRAMRQQMLDEQIRQHEMTSSGEASRAGAVGRAIALQRAGRTPTNDILMQRALARRSLMGQG
jgi:hypothetical protein